MRSVTVQERHGNTRDAGGSPSVFHKGATVFFELFVPGGARVAVHPLHYIHEASGAPFCHGFNSFSLSIDPAGRSGCILSNGARSFLPEEPCLESPFKRRRPLSKNSL
jgi:hypothetical protein